MDSVVKVITVVIVSFFVILFLAGAFGYSLNCTSVDSIAETPCIPVLSNGETNPHYRNQWYECRKSCIGKKNLKLDIKTCNCSCQ
jgi:hypothetical protein